MSTLRADCPRCGTQRITFDTSSFLFIEDGHAGWNKRFEIFGACRNCSRSTTFVIELSAYNEQNNINELKWWSQDRHLNDAFQINGYISLKDRVTFEPPEHVPEHISAIYREGATCASVECFNAAATMFRLCVDLVTKPLLPDPSDQSVEQPKAHQRWNLKARIEWLLDQQKLPPELADLLDNLREDGNDGAHAGTLRQADVDDVADFTNLLLQRLFTDPVRLRLARERRDARRAPSSIDEAS